MNDLHDLIASRLEGSLAAIEGLRRDADAIAAVIHVVKDTLNNGGTVFTCGNGGSAAEALHLAEELVGRYRDNRPPKRAVCLSADPTALTCIANDFGFDEVFARQVDGLGRAGDALVVFSTSGASANIVRALDAANLANMRTIGLLGKGGGDALKRCEKAVVVASSDTAHIQEAHQVILHLILEAVDR